MFWNLSSAATAEAEMRRIFGRWGAKGERERCRPAGHGATMWQATTSLDAN